jgi:cytochrome b561
LFKNSSKSYGLVSILLHWLMALLIFFMFGLGLYMVELTYYDAWYKGSLDLHKSLGITLLVLWFIRLTWKSINIQPNPLPGAKWEQFIAHCMHWLLYLVMFLLMLTGYLISTAKGEPIAVFDLFSFPALPIAMAEQEDIAGEVHTILAWLLITMASLHLLGALKHQLINKDGGLIRMLSVKRKV